MEYRRRLFDLGNGNLKLGLGGIECSPGRIIGGVGDYPVGPELCLPRERKLGFGNLSLLHHFCGAGLGEIGMRRIAPKSDLIRVQPGKNLSRANLIIIIRKDLDDLPRKLRADDDGRDGINSASGAHRADDRATFDGGKFVSRCICWGPARQQKWDYNGYQHTSEHKYRFAGSAESAHDGFHRTMTAGKP